MAAAPQEQKQGSRGRGRPRLDAADVAARRARVIAVATELFIAHGFEATTLDAVALAAGLPKRAIYELVGSKPALFRAACNTLRAAGPGFAFDIAVSRQSVRDVLREMAARLIAHSLRRDLVTLERAVISEAGRSEAIVRETVTEGRENLFAVVGGVFDRLAAEGRIEAVDSREAAEIFYDVAVGARGFRAVLGVAEAPAGEAEIATRIDMFLSGYLLRARAAG